MASPLKAKKQSPLLLQSPSTTLPLTAIQINLSIVTRLSTYLVVFYQTDQLHKYYGNTKQGGRRGGQFLQISILSYGDNIFVKIDVLFLASPSWCAAQLDLIPILHTISTSTTYSLKPYKTMCAEHEYGQHISSLISCTYMSQSCVKPFGFFDSFRLTRCYCYVLSDTVRILTFCDTFTQ